MNKRGREGNKYIEKKIQLGHVEGYHWGARYINNLKREAFIYRILPVLTYGTEALRTKV